MHKGFAFAVVGAIATIAIFAVTNSQSQHTQLFANDFSLHEVSFINYITEYKKSYFNKEEYEYRFSIFRHHLLEIEKHNSNPERTYDQGLNEFCDLTEEEFQQHLGLKVPEVLQRGPQAPVGECDSYGVDWVSAGYVSPIKDQGACGSCWAFSAVGAVESRFAVKMGSTGYLTQLSEQELVDCSKAYGNNGCGGGWMDMAFNYDIAEGGEIKGTDYPYHARDESCKKTGKDKHDRFTGHSSVAASDQGLCSALSTGPVSVAVYANGNFMRYQKGVFSDSTCVGQVNHGVIIAGYDAESYKLRNSWGSSWGEGGYMRMTRTSSNPKGECQVHEYMSYPDGF